MLSLLTLLRSTKRALEIFRRVGVMPGNIFGVITIEGAINCSFIRLAAEFIAINYRIKRARHEMTLIARLGEIQLHFFIGEIHMRE